MIEEKDNMKNDILQKIDELVVLGKGEARRRRNGAVSLEHIMLGIMNHRDNSARRMFDYLKVDMDKVKSDLETEIAGDSEIEKNVLVEKFEVGINVQKALRFCSLEARCYKNAEAEHIMILGILKSEDNNTAGILRNYNITYDRVKAAIEEMENQKVNEDIKIEDGYELAGEDEPVKSDKSFANGAEVHTEEPVYETPILDKFGIDMTKAASEGRLDPVIGRDKEIERISQILSRRKKNNPVLIGEPGVGKSALVEGLAERIVKRNTSRALFEKRVIALDMASVVAGTKYRGQFEERLLGIINELERNPNIILFVDEIHTIIGAGSTPGSMDAANILKPALARGTIQCIGATTLDEYRKSIEKDGALERRFQKVMVEPTTKEETFEILSNIKERYEEFHCVNYTDEAVAACVKLTDRYVTDRSFPDKAIDALDEAGARKSIADKGVSAEIEQKEREIAEIVKKKKEAAFQQQYAEAAKLRDDEIKAVAEYKRLKKEWASSLREQRYQVDVDDVAAVVSMISGVPVQRMQQDEWVRLKGMQQELNGKVVAQENAIDKLCRAIRRSRVGLKSPSKPIGTFMFLGPTGVGKTLLAKELAKFMFGSADALIRIDMSEYMEKFTVSRLVGAPPGYVGYEEGGQLTERVRRRPYSIVLLDEIEKAHTDVFNMLLQVMDEGRLTDSYGRTVDFRNTVIIMTSNIGTRELKDFGLGVGFTRDDCADSKKYSRDVIQKALNKRFAPEFLNRVDEIINFDQLSLDAIVNIVDIELADVVKRIEELGYGIEFTAEAKNFLANKGYDVQFGARPLKRAVQNYVEDEISELLLEGELHEGCTINVEFDKEKDKLTFSVMNE